MNAAWRSLNYSTFSLAAVHNHTAILSVFLAVSLCICVFVWLLCYLSQSVYTYSALGCRAVTVYTIELHSSTVTSVLCIHFKSCDMHFLCAAFCGPITLLLYFMTSLYTFPIKIFESHHHFLYMFSVITLPTMQRGIFFFIHFIHFSWHV